MEQLGPKRFLLIDILRVFACLSVFFYHISIGSRNQNAWQTFKIGDFEPDLTQNQILRLWIENGYLGVDLFFFISGLVIVKSALDKSAIEFLFARFRRLFFPYIFAFALTSVVYIYFSISPIQIESVVLDLSFSAQWRGGYPLVIAATWTLIIEIIFYFIIALLILIKEFFRKFFPQVSLQHLLFFWFFLSWIADEKLFAPPLNLLYLDNYSILFISGSILYIVHSGNMHVETPMRFFVSALIFGALFVHFTSRVSTDSPLIRNCLSLSFAIFLVQVPRFLLKRSESSSRFEPFVSECGRATYSFYLLHQTFGIFVATAMYNLLGFSIFVSLVISFIFLILLSIVFERTNRILWKHYLRR